MPYIPNSCTVILGKLLLLKRRKKNLQPKIKKEAFIQVFMQVFCFYYLN